MSQWFLTIVLFLTAIAPVNAYGVNLPYVDLEENPQDFVLEIKKIDIPGYPDAFNPSIARWQGSLLLCFRTRDPITQSTDPIGFVWLDENFNVSGVPTLLQRPVENSLLPSKAQGPRLIVKGNNLYMVYSNITGTSDKPIRRMFITMLNYDGKYFTTSNPQPILNFDGESDTRDEKNWVPFIFKNNLLLGYSILPHTIFSYRKLGSNGCQEMASTSGSIQWDWGELRGGTPALLVDGEYLAFFHSSIEMKSLQSDGNKIEHYFMGAYTFSPQPPFSITNISPEPIIAKNFYSGTVYQTWKPLRVVFPGGFVFDDNYVWLTYGRQDHEVWVAKLDKAGLYGSLVPVMNSSDESNDRNGPHSRDEPNGRDGNQTVKH